MPPSASGVAAYKQGDTLTAFTELVPLADSGDATAQYYSSLIIMEKTSPERSGSQQSVLPWLINSAKNGNDQAFAMIIVLAMTESQYNAFIEATDMIGSRASGLRRGTTSDGTRYVGGPLRLDGQAGVIAEQVSAGPLSLFVRSEMALAAFKFHEESLIRPAGSIRESDLVSIDKSRAKNGNKYAQARLGNRYAEGLGVERDTKTAFDWHLKAAKKSPAARNCVYQAPVGSGTGSTYCYDAGSATEGIPQAQLAVCKAYAYGRGVSQSKSRAQQWCRKAAENSALSQEATQILTQIR